MEGDENITLSTADEDIVYQSDVLFPAWPNPARAGQEVTVSWHQRARGDDAGTVGCTRTYCGHVVAHESFQRGHHQRSFVLDGLQPATYFYR